MAIIQYPEIPLLQKDLIGDPSTWYPNRMHVQITGRNNVVNNTRIDVWEGPTGTYVFPTAGGIQMHVKSTSANDTAAGTGAQTVHIHYLDASYVEQSEIVTMNGTTAVATVATNILRVNGFHVQTAGTGGVAVGTISLTNTAETVTYSLLGPSFNYARNCIYTVPAGKKFYLTHWCGSSGTATGTHFTQIELRATSHMGVLAGVFLLQGAVGTLNGPSHMPYDIPLHFPAQCDIKVAALSDSASAGAIVNSSFHGWIE